MGKNYKIILLFFLFFIPISVYANTFNNPTNYQLDYQITFDTDYSCEGTNSSAWSTSDYTYYEYGTPSGSVQVCSLDNVYHTTPDSYTYFGGLLWDNEICNTNDIQKIITTTAQEITNLYNFKVELNETIEHVSKKGTWKLLICDDDVGCSDDNWQTNTFDGTNWYNWDFKRSNYNSFPNGYDEIDYIEIQNRNYYGGCGDGTQSETLFSNLRVYTNNDVPARVRVYDDINEQYLQNANVTWLYTNGTIYDSELTDVDGYAFKNKYMENNTYDITTTYTGYYPETTNDVSRQPCNVDISSIDTDEEYFQNCGIGTVTLSEIPTTNVLLYTFKVINVFNEPLENVEVSLTQTLYPYAQFSNYTDNNGSTTLTLSETTTYNYHISDENNEYLEETGSFSTGVLNQSMTFILSPFGCSIVNTISPNSYNVTITNFSQSYTQTFTQSLENTNYLLESLWTLNGLPYSFNYPSLEIIFSETGDFTLTNRIRQTDCVLAYSWDILLSNRIVPKQIENYTTQEQYTKESFVSEIEEFVPAFFILLSFMTIIILFQRVGKKGAK
jgi:hypothetical protein